MRKTLLKTHGKVSPLTTSSTKKIKENGIFVFVFSLIETTAKQGKKKKKKNRKNLKELKNKNKNRMGVRDWAIGIKELEEKRKERGGAARKKELR